MATIRYKKLRPGKLIAYLDVYSYTGEGNSKRNYEFLMIYVDKDYLEASSHIS
ncbi:hypothetical protein ADIARSV_1666 [Arcticibacter svalbardensis MN12-7]|uniref:Uncharacterized protein n=1 Tax=Arcticibacter svalbardensis MN12-7 TaxID=1150600 RepID=R9GU45_9SPHI|nr:hypothetical protein ADIARSV_1666 [Arcticibacter svalbardensis MN12-7]